MVKTLLKVYLEKRDIDRLKGKAEQAGFVGRGSISAYIKKICDEPICFLDSNVKSILKLVNQKS